MAYRLDDSVISGEIFNTTNYCVHGWLELRGWDHPLVLQLTGNCSPDLAGWHFRFESNNAHRGEDADCDSPELESLATQQIGPTGTISVQRVRGTGEAAKDAGTRESGQRQAYEGKRCLCLEWFGQNGRVVIELLDPILEFVEFQELNGSARDADAAPQLGDEAPPPVPPPDAAPAPSEDDVEAEIDAFFSELDAAEEDEDPYQLFPKDLQLQFDLEASQTDASLNDDEDKPRVIRELELMDDLIENSPGVPLSELFDNPVKCPLPDQLDDEQVEAAMKSLLAELALFGVSLEICEHFTAREAYRLLLEEVCPEERAYPELRNTQWVQHYSTSDYCEQCQAEFDREFEQYNRRMQDDPDEDTPGSDDLDDEIPF